MRESVLGVYHNGVVVPKERVPFKEDMEVVILFLRKKESTRESGNSNAYEKLRHRIAQEVPELLKLTPQEKKEDFERLSKKVADNMPFKSVKEMERFMRGDFYGLARY